MILLYQIISAAFSVIVVLSNILSAKMVQLPFFQDLSVPAGLMVYPFTFFLGDLVTEIYGVKKAKQMVYIAFGMCILSYCIAQLALALPSAMDPAAFDQIIGLSRLRIGASLVAFVLAQIVDIQLYALIKKKTKKRFLWLCNNGATLGGQLVDTVLIDMIFLFWGMGMELNEVVPIMLFSYLYKTFCSVAGTPFFYLFVGFLRGKGKRQYQFD